MNSLDSTQPELPPLREIIAEFDLAAKKSLGQNFLLDLNLTRKIARSAGELRDCTILEIGPGPGGLTRALLMEGAEHVVAIERDSRCIAALKCLQDAYPGRLTLIEADAMTFDPTALFTGKKIKIVANLPYNIGTALLINWLRSPTWLPFFSSMTLMFQREVARRIVATPQQQDEYGRLALLANWRCSTQILFDIPPSAFTPPPKVTSSVVSLIPRAIIEHVELAKFEKITETAFSQRRKMLRQSLKKLGDVSILLEAANLKGDERPETLTLSAFIAMARAL